ncbi:MAG: cysteine-rich KTR domain-containing protein [Clostridia bacterium]|nr:cysteine-rich KTR domain-containing protein [Clostridia bacterium]
MNTSIEWLMCPICQNKTRIKMRPDTVLENLPLFCPKCKQETLINVKNQTVSVVKFPDKLTQK